MRNKIKYIACLCAVLFALSAQAEPANCGTNLQWELENDTLKLTSPDSSLKARMTDAPWTSLYSTQIKAVTFPDSLTNITDWAFYGCTALTKITLPDSLKTIGSAAFYGCSALSELRLTNVETISSMAFYACTNLTELTIPDSVTSIGVEAFKGCTSLSSVVCYPEIPPTLGVDAFANCAANLDICTLFSLGSYKATNWNDYDIHDCSDTPTDVEAVSTEGQPYKMIEDKHIIIIRNNEKYSIDGKKL